MEMVISKTSSSPKPPPSPPHLQDDDGSGDDAPWAQQLVFVASLMFLCFFVSAKDLWSSEDFTINSIAVVYYIAIINLQLVSQRRRSNDRQPDQVRGNNISHA